VSRSTDCVVPTRPGRCFLALIPRYLRWLDNPVEAWVGRLVGGRSLQVFRMGGREILVDHSAADLGSIGACRPDGAYGRLLKQSKVSNSPTVLDLGANIGGFPILLRLLGYEIAQLVSVELNPSTVRRLTWNATAIVPSALVLNRALTADGRSVEVTLGKGSTSDSIYRERSGGVLQSVEGMTFDDAASLIEGPIDLCKIDVEHAEAEVLASGSPAISSLQRVRNLLIEIHPAKRLDEIVETIEAHGLRWCGCEHSDGRPALGVNAFRRDEA